MGECERFAASIGDCMAGATAHLEQIRQAMDDLAAAGMWPSVPTEDWSDNTGMYMLFRSNRDGTYKGPGGKREICAGRDPAAIAEARRLPRTGAAGGLRAGRLEPRQVDYRQVDGAALPGRGLQALADPRPGLNGPGGRGHPRLRDPK